VGVVVQEVVVRGIGQEELVVLGIDQEGVVVLGIGLLLEVKGFVVVLGIDQEGVVGQDIGQVGVVVPVVADHKDFVFLVWTQYSQNSLSDIVPLRSVSTD